MKKIIYIICLVFILFSCGNNEYVNNKGLTCKEYKGDSFFRISDVIYGKGRYSYKGEEFVTRESGPFGDYRNITSSYKINDGKKSTYSKGNGIVYSPDGNSSAYIVENQKSFVVKDGIEGTKDKYRYIYRLNYSSDSNHLSYYARLFNGGGHVFVRDGIENKIYRTIEQVVHSPIGNSYAYIANGKYIIKDGIEYGPYDRVQSIGYTLNGKHFIENVFENNKRILIIDGKKIDKYDDIYPVMDSPEKDIIAFVARKDRKRFVVINSKEGKKYLDIKLGSFSDNGESYFYFGSTYGKIYLIKDGVKILINDNYHDDYLTSSNLIGHYYNDGGFSYLSKINGKYVFVKDGIKSKGYDKISSIKYSNDGKSFAFIGLKDGKEFIVKDMVEDEKKYEKIVDLEFIGNGNDLVYVGSNNGKKFLIENGIEMDKHGNIIDLIYKEDGYYTIKDYEMMGYHYGLIIREENTIENTDNLYLFEKICK